MPRTSQQGRQAARSMSSGRTSTSAQDDVDWVYCHCEEGRKRKPRRAILLKTATNKNGNQGRMFFKCRRKTGCNFFLWQDELERLNLDLDRLVDDALGAISDDDDPHDHVEHPQPGSSNLGASSFVDVGSVERAPVVDGKKRARSEDDDDVKPPSSVKKVRFDLRQPEVEVKVKDVKPEVVGDGSGGLKREEDETVEDSDLEEELALGLDELNVKVKVESVE
ncbi:hypothetical protein JCM3775_006038 [Rhodotorula graminis]